MISNSTKRRRIQLYFSPFPKWIKPVFWLGATIAAAGGLPTFGRTIRESIVKAFDPSTTDFTTPWIAVTTVFGIGVLLLLCAIIAAASDWFARPADKQIDQWYRADRANLFTHGLRHADLDPSQIPSEKQLLIFGLWIGTGTDWRFRIGKDRILRLSHTEALVLFFAENQLVVYAVGIDHLRGDLFNEQSYDVYYRFVAGVSVSDQSATVRLPGNKQPTQINAIKTFSLIFSGDKLPAINLRLGDEQLARQLGGRAISHTEVDKAINAARKLIRDKNVSSGVV